MFDRLMIAIGRALEAASFPYMVIGGQAVLLYGEARLTRDIDITLGVDAGALDRLLGLAGRLGLRTAVADPAGFVAETNVLPVAEPESGIRVDFIFSFTPYEAAAIERAPWKQMGEVHVRFAAVEDLIIHKLFAGRPRDIEDIRGILRRRHPLAMDHLRLWLPRLSDATGRNLWEEFETLTLESGPRQR